MVNRLNQLQHTVNSLPCHGRNKHLRRIFHIFQFHGNILEIFIHGLFVLINGIPFIDGNNCRLSSFVGNACNLGILICNAFVGINQKNRNITAFHCRNRTDNAEAFDFLLDFAFAAHPCRINEDILLSVNFNRRIDCISCRACNIADNQSVLTENLIDERGFAHIGLPNDGNLNGIIILLMDVLFREIRDNLVKHIAQAQCLPCGNRQRIADAQFVKFINRQRITLYAVHLIHRQNNRLFRAAQQICNLHIILCYACFYVCDKQNYIRGFNRNLCLLHNLLLNHFFGADFHTAGIN